MLLPPDAEGRDPVQGKRLLSTNALDHVGRTALRWLKRLTSLSVGIVVIERTEAATSVFSFLKRSLYPIGLSPIVDSRETNSAANSALL